MKLFNYRIIKESEYKRLKDILTNAENNAYTLLQSNQELQQKLKDLNADRTALWKELEKEKAATGKRKKKGELHEKKK